MVTFVTMAHIVVLNPLIIGSVAAGGPGAKTDVLGNVLPAPQVAAVTALVAGVLTLFMGLVTNYPFALATGLGINTFVALTLAPMMSWRQAMGLVMLNGLIVLILVATGFRTAVFNAVPAELKAAIAVGIGLFICFIGLVDAGFVRRLPDAAGTTVPVGLGVNGSLATWPTAVLAVGLLGTVALVARRVRGALLIGVLSTAVLAIAVEAVVQVGPSKGTDPRGWSLGYPAVPDQILGIPDLALLGDFSFGAVLDLPILAVALLVFTLVLTDFFDSIGILTGLGEAGFVHPDGTLPGVGRALAGPRDRLHRFRYRNARLSRYRGHAVQLLHCQWHRRGLHLVGAATRGDRPGTHNSSRDVGGGRRGRALLRGGLTHRSSLLVGITRAGGGQCRRSRGSVVSQGRTKGLLPRPGQGPRN